MGGLFAMDGKLAQIMGKLADIIILNLLLVVCSVPVVTAGASATAFYAVMLKLVKNEESYVFRSFFKAFRENFRQATVVYLIMLAVAAVLGFDFYFAVRQGGGTGQPLFVVFCILALFLYLGSCYLFPMMAFFENRTKKVFQNSFLMAIAHFPYTLLIGIISAIPWVVLLYGMLLQAVLFDLLIGFSLAGFLNSLLLRRIFKRYVPEETEEQKIEEAQ